MTKNIGSKTERLQELKTLGFKVPKFTYITNEKLAELLKDGKLMKSECEKMHLELNCESYAVRSSALIEDAEDKSFAGQFMTELDVKSHDLEDAIRKVAEQAGEFLKGEMDKFSIIVQEYIKADYSGVAFTRNPLGGREIIVEYHKGVGEDLVSGRIKPERGMFFWNSRVENADLPGFFEAVESIKKIELHYKFPQDIEWCVKDGEWFFLQTRPITTIDNIEYQQSLFLDDLLSKDGKFFYEKTEISEIAARPVPVTEKLLEMIYAEGGPVMQVYKKFGISYVPRCVLKIIGNELYIDREEELKTILPSYTFFKRDDKECIDLPGPKFGGFKGFLRTLTNYIRLNVVSIKGYEELIESIRDLLSSDKKVFIDDFLKQYQKVFEVNFLTGYAYKKLELALQKDKSRMSQILGSDLELFGLGEIFKVEFDGKGLKGNSLDIGDETQFMLNGNGKREDKELKEWWLGLPDYRKQLLKNPIRLAIIYNRLRECSRWLVVKNVNSLREELFVLAGKHGFKEKELIYFADNFNTPGDEKKCLKRREEYKKFNKFDFPKTIYYRVVSGSLDLLSVSSGLAKGVLVTEDQLELKEKKGEKGSYILFTKNLEPRLSVYFGRIKGIMSEQGSLLSHLAIIAREERLPVIVNFSIGRNGVQIGDMVTISDNPAEVQKE